MADKEVINKERKTMKVKVKQQLNKLEEAITDLECISTIIYQEIIDNDEFNPLIDYIIELEKDYYFRNKMCKDRLTIEKIIEDLIRLVKEIKE